jgi:chromosome segregation ATPase
MVADIACHNLDGENPHTHIMLTTREITPEGFGKKNREWNDRELHDEWRKEWANHANKALEKAGSQERIDYRSLKDQGIQREPQIHVGPHASAMEKRGIPTERGEQNRKIIDLNEYRERHRKEVIKLNNDIKEYDAEVIRLKAQKQQPKLQQPDLKEKLEDARKIVNETYHKMSQQRQAVTVLNSEINTLKSKLYELDRTENFLQATEEKLGKINKFNPFKRAEIKELQDVRERHKHRIEGILGRDSRQSLVQQLREKEKVLPKEERKLAEVETRYTRAKHNFDGLSEKKKKLDHEQELAKGKELQTRMKAGEKLTVQEYKLLISHAKELGINPKDLPKMPKVKSVDLGRER